MIVLRQATLFGIDDKVKQAIDFIKRNEPNEGYFVAFSGGKDSVVVYDLVKKAGVKFKAYYAATQIDPPELTHFIHKYYPDVEWLFPEESIFKVIPKKGFPTMIRRWCCDYLKKRPTRKIPLKHRIVGVRAQESWRRAREKDNPSRIGKYFIYKPIYNWHEFEVWEYIRKNKLPYCRLYDEGFSRIGCVICPFLSYEKHFKNRKRWPQHYRAFEKAMRSLWEKRDKYRVRKQGYNWSFREYLDRWYLRLKC